MNRTILISCLLVALLAGAVSVKADDAKLNVPPEGFKALFNGKNLDGWHGCGHFNPFKLKAMSDEERAAKRKKDDADFAKHWRVDPADGSLVNDGHGVYATTDKDYENFELMVDYKTVAKADSGIYLRMTPQVQIWDYTKEGGKWNIGADKGSGGLWNNAPGAKAKIVRRTQQFGRCRSCRNRARTHKCLSSQSG